jgi:hypothetical protein
MKNIPISILLILSLSLASYGCSGKFAEHAVNVKQAIEKQEQFTGLTREQVVERFGKPATFQNIRAIGKDGRWDHMEVITYPTWDWRIVVTLKNNIVIEVFYEKHPSLAEKENKLHE